VLNTQTAFAQKSIPKGLIVFFECNLCRKIDKDEFELVLTNQEYYSQIWLQVFLLSWRQVTL
jgi:hypothetical protein